MLASGVRQPLVAGGPLLTAGPRSGINRTKSEQAPGGEAMEPQAARLSSLRPVLVSMAKNGRQPQWRPQKVLLCLAALDEALGGGLPRGTLHEIAAASEADMA